MGLLDNISTYKYYEENPGNSDLLHGHYRFTTLDNIINAFMTAYVGEDKIIPRVNRTDVQFHAMRAIQELSYDVLRSIKSQEIEIPNTLKMPLPIDYVNYVKLVRSDSNGTERIIYPTNKTSNPFAIEQEADGSYSWDEGASSAEGGGDSVLKEQGTDQNWHNIEEANTYKPFSSDTLRKFHNQTTPDVYADDKTDVEVDNRGRRYGLDPQHAQANGMFFIDYRTGFIYFGSSLAGETIILKYISDGLGTDEEMVVHKFCEEAVYKWIMYGILSTRSNTPEYIVQRYKKEKFAETRKAKIRLSNIKIEEFTQVLKGLSKPIK
tara:strand:+ start:1056 stop:2021 length:966 start_codon:yes stop_codon:yes gene_type:complete